MASLGLFIDWLIMKFTSVAPSTRRLYRAAVMWALEDLRQKAEGDISQEEIASAITCLSDAAPPDRSGGRTLRTSAKKARLLTAHDLDILAQVLEVRDGEYDRALLQFLRANVAAGLRPSEWASATGIRFGSLFVLRVVNGKAGQGRAHGKLRHLVWSEAGSPTGAAIEEWLATVAAITAMVPESAKKSEFAGFMKALGDRLADVCDQTWPRRHRHPSLYTTRHTAIALFKTRFDAATVAALAGHAVDVTATHHYARVPKGHRSTLPRVDLPVALPREVALVRRTFDPSAIPSGYGGRRHER